MRKLFMLGLIIVILGVVSTLWSKVSAQTGQAGLSRVDRAGDAAYRDGLFLGRLDAQAGRVHRACVGRWSTGVDREAFALGYADGNTGIRTEAGN